MKGVLALTHLDETGTRLTRGSLEAATAAKALSERLNTAFAVGIVGAHCATAAQAVAGYGARLMTVEGEAFGQARYATDAAACKALWKASEAELVLAPQDSRFGRVMGGVAHRVGGSIDTHVTRLEAEDGLAVTRSVYRQRIETVVQRESRPWFLMLEGGVAEPLSAGGGEAFCEVIAAELPAPVRTRVTGVQAPQLTEQTIRPDAKLLFVAGAGWTKKQPDGKRHASEAGGIIQDFLGYSGASLGSSKSLVDQGNEGTPVLPFLTHMNQVGQTGSTPRHSKGLSTCCHGEEPHVVGWRFIGERRAISLDANCGWARGKADVVYIADAFQVMAKVNALLKDLQAEMETPAE